MPRNYSAKPRWGWDFAGQSYGFMQDFTRLFYIQRNKEQPTYCSKPCARCYLPQPSASDSLPCILSACGHFAEFWKGKSPFCLFTSKGTRYKQGKVCGFKCLFSFLFLSLFFLFFLSALPSFLHYFSPPLSSFSLPLSFPLSLPSLFFFLFYSPFLLSCELRSSLRSAKANPTGLSIGISTLIWGTPHLELFLLCFCSCSLTWFLTFLTSG